MPAPIGTISCRGSASSRNEDLRSELQGSPLALAFLGRLPARPRRLRGMKRARNGAAKAGSADEKRAEVLERETKALAQKYTRGDSVKTRVRLPSVSTAPFPPVSRALDVLARERECPNRFWRSWSRTCPERKTSNPNRAVAQPRVSLLSCGSRVAASHCKCPPSARALGEIGEHAPRRASDLGTQGWPPSWASPAVWGFGSSAPPPLRLASW